MTTLPPGREDPRTLGCQCDACPLGQLLRERNEWLPVASEDHDSSVVILAEAPGQEEVPEGRPLVGRSGQEVMRALNAVGVYRGDASYANTLRCFPGETRVSASGVQLGFRRWYAGELVTIQTRSGHKLTGTPNHPVFTEQGGVSLGVLKVGDHVLRRRGSDGVPAGDPDVQDAPATLDECFRTLSHLRTAAQWRGRQRVVDFHGDGRDGEVEVVGAHRELTNWLQALGTEELVQRRLPNADVTLPLLPSGDAALMELGGVQDTALGHRSACGSCECLSRLKGGSAHSETVALGSVPEGDSVLHQGAAHNAFVNIQAGGDGLQALPGKVHGENGLGIEDVPTLFPAESHRFGFGPQDPLCQQDAPNARLLGVQLAREFLDRFPSEVALDEIVHIDRRRWAGHVYDLQTEGGWFFAEGILVSNCRPPNNDWKLFHYRYVDKPNSRINAANKRIAKENRTRKERGLPLEPLKALIPQPLDCCRPQLLRQVERTPNIIAAGVTAYYALTGKRKSIRKIRGSFNDYWLMASTETGARYLTPAPEGWVPGNMQGVVFPLGSTFIKHVRILPTLHPAFVLRTPAWRPLFQGDVARFFRWMQGNLKWTPPKIFVAPDERFLRDFLWDPRIGFHTVDCETDGLNVLDLGWTREEQDQGFKWANATLAQRKGVWKPEYAATAKQREKTPLPKVAKVRCVQIGAPDGRCVVIPLRSVDGHTGMERWYPSPVTAARIVQILKDWLTDASRQKVGHNHLYFDNQMLKTEFGIEVQNVTDTMILFRGAASELRRDLYTLGTFLTDVPDWKTGGDDRNVSVRPRSDHELHVYGATDVHVTAAVAPPLVQMVHARGQAQAMFTDHSMSHIAREMYALGIGRVNEPKRAALEEELLEKVTKYRSEIQRLTTPDWNPRSLADLTNLFVEKWGLPILGETPTGEPSWDDATLRAYRQAGVLNPEQTALFDFLRGFRTADKILGTYVRPWRRWNDYRRTSTGKLVGGKVGPDGRLHAHFNVAAPKTGRISSSDPNCQNVIEFVRALLEPEDGHLFVGADYDQIELRIVAALARLAGYLGVFKADGDPHAVTSLLIYGEVFRECLELMLDHKPGSAVGGGMSQWEKFTKTGVPEKPTDARESALKFDATDPEKSFQRTARYLREHDGLSWPNEDAARKHVAKVHRLSKMYKQLRVFAKTFVYAVIYGGTANTVYQSVSAAEDPKTGKLLFPDMTLKEVRTAYNAFMNNAPELKIWWEQTWEFARRNGYVTECITGYRRDFPEFERNEILNLPVQGAAAKIMTLGMIRLRERVAPGQFGPKTGIVMQVHDFAMVEVPEAQADEMCDTVQSSLTMTFDQLAGVTCSAAAKKAANWMAA